MSSRNSGKVAAVVFGIALLSAPVGATVMAPEDANDDAITIGGVVSDDGVSTALRAFAAEAPAPEEAQGDALAGAHFAGSEEIAPSYVLSGSLDETSGDIGGGQCEIGNPEDPCPPPPTVPEPGTFTLLGAGLLGVALQGRRR